MSAPGWDGLLNRDERIIWQGRPDPGFYMPPRNIFLVGFGLFFAAFATFWMVMASQAGGFFWAFGIIHFSVGIGLAGSNILWNTLKRRGSWYTLTNQRAHIATQFPWRGQRLQSYPMNKDTELDFREGRLSSIFFAQEIRRVKSGTNVHRIGFERIEDGRDVFAKMRDVQNQSEASQ